MGRYTDPKIILDKRFEVVAKGLETLYSNVQKNSDAIQARAQKKKALQDKIIKDYGSMYLKNTQESYNRAVNWAESNKNAFEEDNALVGDIQNIYRGGLDDIVDFIQTGASESEILSLVNQRSNDANKLTKGVVGFSNISATNNDGLQKIGSQTSKIKGNKTGDVVIGSDNAGIFAATGTKIGDQIPISELRVVGDLKSGVNLFYDREPDGEVGEGEVLDLFKMGENYEDGNTDAYFKTVEDITDIVKENSTQLKNLGKDGAFTKEVVYEENGAPQKVVYVDEKKRQDYFLDESTAGGKLINNIIASKDLTMLAQLVGGVDFAYHADFANNPAEMEILKVGLIDKLIPSLFPGSQKLAPSSFGDKVSKSITVGNVDPDIATLEEWAKPTHEDVRAFRENTDNIDILQKYLGASFKEGTGSLSGGKITSIEYADPSGANNKVKVTYQPTGSQAVSKVYDMALPDGSLSGRQFEANIMLGTFPNAKPTKIQGVIGGLISGEPFKGDQETSTRTTTKKGISIMSQDEFDAMRSGSENVLEFDNLYDQWHGGIYGNQNPAQANVATGTAGAAATGSGTAGAGTAVTGSAGSGTAGAGTGNAATQVSTYSFTQASGLQGSMSFGTVPSNSAGNPQIVVDSDPSSTSSQIAKVLNWENENNFQDYGFTGTGGTPGLSDGYKEIEKQIKSSNSNISGPQLKAMAAEETTSKYLIGEDGVDLGSYAGKTILQNLDIDRATFDGLDPELKHYLIDYKVNVTNRSAKDLIMILTGEWDGQKAGGKVSDLSDEDKDAYDNFKFDATKLQDITPRELEIAKLSLYTDGGTNLTRQANSKGVRPDQAGATGKGRMSDVKVSPKEGKSSAADVKSFKEKVLENYNNIEEYYIRRKLLPGDKITMANGEVFEIPKY